MCDTANKGTYLSNVCWLIEDFTRGVRLHEVVSANQDECTATTEFGQTIYFKRSDGNIQFIREGGKLCWKLFGDGVLEYDPDAEVFGNLPPWPRVEMCGNVMEISRIERAFNNLFTKYCPVEVEEF